MKEADNEVQICEHQISFKLRMLAANLIRIVRGAGKLYEVEAHITDLASDFQRYRDLTSSGVPQHIIDAALCIDKELDNRNPLDRPYQEGEATMVRGALQYAAATLLNQNTFGAKGRDEMLIGAKRIQDAKAAIEGASWNPTEAVKGVTGA